MRRQRLSGMPRRCPNTNCNAPFTRECHQGYVPSSTLEVLAMMKCPRCGWLWPVQQALYQAHEYFMKLPKDERSVPKAPITSEEAKCHRRWLDKTKNPLETLFEGPRPDKSE